MKNMSKFYKEKNVFITGHTGFKGSWLSIWLNHLGADVTGFSNAINTDQDNFVLSNVSDKIVDVRGDIRNPKQISDALQAAQPEIVFHLAAQPLVRDSYENPGTTYMTNVIGTLNLLEAIRSCDSVRSVVIVTTDKCYKNNEWVWGYRENDELGGYDPYSSSKACCEMLVDSYRKSFFSLDVNQNDICKTGIATARAGNVIGGGDWSKDRIIPDCMRSLMAGKPIQIRNPHATRPWQHVLEPLGGYLILAMKLFNNPKEYSEAFNFGPQSESIVEARHVINKMTGYIGEIHCENLADKNSVHEANLLNLDISKATNKLGWHPIWNIDEAINKTADWYKNFKHANVYDMCINQINEYQELINW